MCEKRIVSEWLTMALLAMAFLSTPAGADDQAGPNAELGKKAEPVADVAKSASVLVAVVGDAGITEQALLASMKPTSRNTIDAAGARIVDIELQAIQELFASRYATSEAARRGVSEEELYRSEIAANRERLPAQYANQISEVLSSIYQQKRRALDELIDRTLEKQAAEARGLAVDTLLRSEVEDRVGPVSQAEVDRFYEKYKSQILGRTQEEAAPQIEAMIKKDRITLKRREYDALLRDSTPVQVLLEPPRVPVVPGTTARIGAKESPVQVVLFSDFECPFCGRAENILKDVKKRYGDLIAISFRDFPLPFHTKAGKAAEAARCADAQGKYLEYRDSLFADQSNLSPVDLKARADKLGMDVSLFDTCLDAEEMKTRVGDDLELGAALGVVGTPTAYVNGRLVGGHGTLEDYSLVIDDELQLKGIRIPPEEQTGVASAAGVAGAR